MCFIFPHLCHLAHGLVFGGNYRYFKLEGGILAVSGRKIYILAKRVVAGTEFNCPSLCGELP